MKRFGRILAMAFIALLLTGCRSGRRARHSVLSFRVMSVEMHWEYTSTPIDTTPIPTIKDITEEAGSPNSPQITKEEAGSPNSPQITNQKLKTKN